MLVGNGAGSDTIRFCYFQIEGRIEDSPNAVILRCYFSWNRLILLLNKNGVILLI